MTPQKLQYRTRLWPTAAIFGLLLALHVYSPNRSSLWLQTFYEFSHFAVFGLVSLAAFLLTPVHLKYSIRYFLAFGITLTLGIVSEAMQIPTGRDASVEDLLMNGAGAASFLLASATWSRRIGHHTVGRITTAICSLVIFAWAATPLLKISAAYLERDLRRPVIVSFEDRFEYLLIRKQNSDVIVTSTDNRGHCGMVSLHDGAWPGIEIHDLWPDWQTYTSLSIRMIVYGDTPLELHVRVHDQTHEHSAQNFNDRFNRKFVLSTGPNALNISLSDIESGPIGREMDMAGIQSLILFSKRKHAGRSYCLDEIRLE